MNPFEDETEISPADEQWLRDTLRMFAECLTQDAVNSAMADALRAGQTVMPYDGAIH
jgi:hypothetical protein